MTLGTPHEKPVYVRLREVIADAILAGKYGDGDPLPSVRAFAADQGANPLTVAKAYQGFQDEGLIEVRAGLFVAYRVLRGASGGALRGGGEEFTQSRIEAGEVLHHLGRGEDVRAAGASAWVDAELLGPFAEAGEA